MPRALLRKRTTRRSALGLDPLGPAPERIGGRSVGDSVPTRTLSAPSDRSVLRLLSLVALAAAPAMAQPADAPAVAGGGGVVQVRTGLRTICSDEPLYVVDGVRAPRPTAGTHTLAQLALSDIVFVEVMTADEARARYGREAERGVILITTRHAASVTAGPFPNPVLSGGEVTLPDVPEGFESAEVLDVQGRRVAVVHARTTSGVVVPTQGLPAGVYLVRLRGDAERSARFVVQ